VGHFIAKISFLSKYVKYYIASKAPSNRQPAKRNKKEGQADIRCLPAGQLPIGGVQNIDGRRPAGATRRRSKPKPI
jgi:hypothetical protein